MSNASPRAVPNPDTGLGAGQAGPSTSRPVDLPTPIDTSAPHSRSLSPGAQTPQSAIIAVPYDWSYNASPRTSLAASRGSFESDARDASMPMSASSSSSSSRSAFQYPPNLPTSSRMNQTSFDSTRGPSDPFENPFDGRRFSGESDEYSSRQSFDLDATPLPVPNEMRRESITMVPHVQLRTLTEPMIHDGVTIDAEFSGLPISAVPTDGFPFDPDAMAALTPPNFHRTFSAPLPSRVGALRHPLSATTDPLGSHSAHPPRHHSVSVSSGTPTMTEMSAMPPLSQLRQDTNSSGSATLVSRASSSSAIDHGDMAIRTLSVELADSVQSAIQTLLHLSPPHLLDNAKEQYSGCTVQMPSTSLSALLTAMKSLNYFSANAQSLMEGLKPRKEVMERERRPSGPFSKAVRGNDFDIGELLQSVADLLGGQAAQLGVDLVLFHGDVGIKHVAVNGDGEGLGYLLSHVLRQILAVASAGDTIELGLQLVPQSPSMTPRVALPLTANDIAEKRTMPSETGRPASPGRTLPTPPSGSEEGPLLCIFEIVHNISQAADAAETPRAETNPFVYLSELRESSAPRLDTVLCRRLLQHQNANLRVDTQPSSPIGSGLPRKAYELTVLLSRGVPLVEPVSLSTEEEAVRQPFTSMKLAREPTLSELSSFAESLRGKKVVLHASLSSVFARHLTSYLAAWGMDISHVPVEDTEENQAHPPGSAPPRNLDASLLPPSASTPDLPASLAAMSLEQGSSKEKFVIIDDDVVVLKRELTRLRAEVYSQYKPRLTKRPTLSSRTRSSPLVRLATNTVKPANSVLIHFTSLGNYNQVRDIISSLLGAPHAGTAAGTFLHPEVMVVPKPVGPRRFLTALHTAVHQPVVDPFFSPIATSPRSPGGEYFNGRSTPTGSEGQRDGFFDAVVEENEELHPPHAAEGKARSPLGEYPPAVSAASGPASVVQTSDGLRIALPTPGVKENGIVATPAAEYFSNALGKSSPSSGSAVVMQSPDGRPFGMFFEPPIKAERRQSGALPGMKRRMTSRRTSINANNDRPPSATHSDPARGERSVASSRRSSGAADLGNDSMKGTRPDPASRRKTMPSQPSDAVPPTGRDRSATITKKAGQQIPAKERAGASNAPSPTPAVEAPTPPVKEKRGRDKAAKAAAREKQDKDDVVVPPINVLIVEDNPINQNILSMFLRKKKIKHGTAKDGLEAVEKWRTGGYHLILMDIQLPVMDGIEATKEIRKLERSNNIGVFPSTPIAEHPMPAPMSTVSRLSGAATPAGDGRPSTPFRSSVIIVALTASSLQSDRVVALAAGCNDFLTKPVSLKWLERKIVEWGCMQALIDFDGWRRAKSSDPKEETRRGFQTGPQAAAKTLANRLKINPDRKASRQTSVSSIGSTRSDGASSTGAGTGVPRVQVLPETPASQTASPVSAAALLPAVEAAAEEITDGVPTPLQSARGKDVEDATPTPTPNHGTPSQSTPTVAGIDDAGISAGPGDKDFEPEKKDRTGEDLGPEGTPEPVSAEAVQAAAEAAEQAPPVPSKNGEEEKPLPAVPPV